MSKILRTLGDLTAVVSGYVSVNPHANILDGLHHVIADATPILTGQDTSQVVKMVVGLLIGLLSKFLYGLLDKWLKKKKSEPAKSVKMSEEIHLSDPKKKHHSKNNHNHKNK